MSHPQVWTNAGSQWCSINAHWMDGLLDRHKEKKQGGVGGEVGRKWLSQSQMRTCSPPPTCDSPPLQSQSESWRPQCGGKS